MNHAVILMIMFLIVFVAFFSPIFQISRRRGNGKNAETESVANRLDELTPKLDVIATVIFMLFDVNGESMSKQQQPCYFL